ncbi:MAG TPA: tRNA epoxyqueuosine(34) reductase QueG [Planctomycetota bacterium]|nr:tRNA epoxyqueuosine(34) reductase QueG [Planctomycetota bacterium]
MDRSAAALEIAREVGFDLAGVAPVRPPQAASLFDAWLAQGRHGGMTWLERNRDRIVDPRRVMPSGKSLLVVGLAHARAAVATPDGGRVARYAAGRDYHNVMGRMLMKLARGLRAAGLVGRSRRIVDAGPLLERSHAAEAGLGFESKAANLLHPSFGPWFFLGELILDVELEPTTSAPAGSCGTCTACLDACPTGAIVSPGEVDARTCISYQTIENQGVVPAELREKIGDWAFGCDVCSEICPWGSRAGDHAARFGTHPVIESAGLVEWVEAGESLAERLGGSPLQRPHRAGLARNAAIVLGNRPSDAGRVALLHALTFDPSEVVREAAAWSLAQAHGSDAQTREALERAARLDPSETARDAIRDWRANCS